MLLDVVLTLLLLLLFGKLLPLYHQSNVPKLRYEQR